MPPRCNRLLRILTALAFLTGLPSRGAIADTISPTAADRQLFETGVRQQRAVNIFSDPRSCGIVLLRPYCRDAFTALADNVSGVPGLANFIETGNIDATDKKWADANDTGIGMADALWKEKPRDTWLRAAGIEYAAYYTPGWDSYSMMQIPVYRLLVQYASDAAPYDTLLSVADRKAGPSGVSVQDPARIATYFVPALGLVFPQAPEPVVNVPAGIIGDARLGVYYSTAQEMFESPVLFLAPSSRAFLNAFTTRLEDRQLGARFESASNPDEWKAAISDLQTLEVSKLRSLPKKSKDACLFGIMAAQAAYNAAVLREKPAEGEQFGVLQSNAGVLPGRISSKVPAVLAAKDDWHALNKAATALTMEIMGQ